MTEWLNFAVNNRYMSIYPYNEFHNVKYNGNSGGEGRFSRVASAEWPCTNRKVALKNLKNFNVDKFVSEVQMHTQSHSSKNIVRFLGLTKENETGVSYLMVFEYADRNNLRIFLKSLKLDLMIRVKLSLDIAKGLSYLHQLKIIHRDLHSNNIVINQVHSCDQLEFIAKITDFGSAINEEDDDINDKTGVIGQIPFTDPQYLNNPKHYRKNMKSDIYSLGVILWEISSSKAPFENFMADSRGEFRDLCLTFEIINDYRERHTLFTPENFVKLSRQCWDNDPNKRPDIKTVIDDLNSIFAGLPQVLERNATIGQ
ncbi:uncharacterized protein OCT59_014259 [Rhizophagus irregularis]|uniref:Mkk1p n=4 Tax=Rhizophagus irregularis TaxID=588596 RepID=A0A015KN89_RHIIW|nr:Mkk1p [Rhizophagus irregularis DAOM 197198w]UZO21876.1 hypothetical protein OCT59_014259 [Rhizophagus irregularis]GBC44770.2 kinase-like domain-containing protein [Rhizophagus irregularis DAOM 181602=DAOM 197198]CAB4480730.1 unnamed protein product [Rhizophagus irregularis]CAB5179221.1 unnamed protein product [Rhizophagus irregularis]